MRFLRPRFTLRTLFVVVTLLAIPSAWVGWQYRIVQERQEFVKQFPQAFGFWPGIDDGITIPWIRSVLGDEAKSFVYMPKETSDEVMARIAALFPEAEVYREQEGVPSFRWVKF